MDAKKLDELSKKLDYKFNNEKLLELALCHRSLGQPSNERLEFLGDSVLNFIIASELFVRYPNVDEGELTRLRSNLVKGETLADLAMKLNLNKYISLGLGEIKTGGSLRPSILADAFEAVIASIYLDSGIETCRANLLKYYADIFANEDLSFLKDGKTRLQELMHHNKLSLPCYKIVDIQGDAHDQTFYVECKIENLDFIAKASGKSKRKAEKNCAKIMFDYLRERPNQLIILKKKKCENKHEYTS